MRLEDNMMPVLTGLVFAVVLGVTVQNSDDLMKAFGATDQVAATDDVFFVRAGADASLDVLANDGLPETRSSEDIQIVAGPACGDVIPTANGISYVNSRDCEGPVHFSYCLGQNEACHPAEVTMRVRPAPMAVADAFHSETGGLVPLTAKDQPAAQNSTKTNQAAPLSAYVVSIAPQTTQPVSVTSDVSRYLADAVVSDLKKDPVNDLSKLSGLGFLNVPLSAVRTARFLKDHALADPQLTDLARPLLDMEGSGSSVDTEEMHDETVQIDLRVPATATQTDRS